MSQASVPVWRHGIGILLLSLATLLLELSLTRVLSVALWYHFGFLVVATALLGFGASGVTLALWTWLRDRAALDRALATISLLFGVSTVACFWLAQRIPFDPLAVLSDRRQLLFVPAYYVTLAAPFFFSGLALALLFTRGTRDINRLYALDLVGAGLGCAALAVTMPSLGGSGSVVASAAVGIVAAAIFAGRAARGFAAVSLALALALGTLAPSADRVLPISITPLKRRPPDPPIHTEWNTFSRIDVWERHVGPPNGGTTFRRFVFDGGTAATGLQALRPDARAYLNANPDDADYPSGAAYVGKSKPSVLVIGSGAGAEVLAALHFGARAVTAVEINPIINRAVSTTMRDHWGGLFNLPEVRLITEDGRSFVRRSREQYDAIVSVHTISNAAVASGALSLAENYVLTREAFDDYLERLTPDGVIYFTRPEPQIARLVATAREALARRGVADASGHVYAYRLPPDSNEARFFGANRPAFEAGVFVKRSPFTADEIRRMERLLGVGQPPRPPAIIAPEMLYSPVAPGVGGIYHALLTTGNLDSLYRAQVRQIEPATDDRPFFNHLTRWSSIDRSVLGEVFGQQRLGTFLLGDRPVAELSLLVLLAQVVAVAAVLMLLPLARWANRGLEAPHRWRYLTYFAALGLGFIMIEIALLSRFTLFLGQPVYTFSVVLASLLVATGIGSFVSGRWRQPPQHVLRRAIPVVILVLIVTTASLAVVFNAALGFPFPARLAIAVLMLLPLGIALGIPFPVGLQLVSGAAQPLVPWAWGINGFCTVIGSVLAVILGMTFGFRLVLILGALCYLVAWSAITMMPRSHESTS